MSWNRDRFVIWRDLLDGNWVYPRYLFCLNGRWLLLSEPAWKLCLSTGIVWYSISTHYRGKYNKRPLKINTFQMVGILYTTRPKVASLDDLRLNRSNHKLRWKKPSTCWVIRLGEVAAKEEYIPNLYCMSYLVETTDLMHTWWTHKLFNLSHHLKQGQCNGNCSPSKILVKQPWSVFCRIFLFGGVHYPFATWFD